MAKPACRSCSMRGICRDSAASWVFFFIGIIATVGMRVIEPLRTVNPLYGKISWYVGVVGFFLFFVYKYSILRRQSEIIRKTGLAKKLASSSRLSDEEYRLLAEIVCSQDNRKERINFFAIFLLSALALAFAVWTDLVRY